MNSLIQTPTPKLAQSLDFYKKLNFVTHKDGNRTFVTDGKALVEISEARFARAGIKLYRSDWSDVMSALGDTVSSLQTETGYLVTSPSGVPVYLDNGDQPIVFTPAENSTGVPGNYMGVSLETVDMMRSSEFWKTLGFEAFMGDPTQGWVAMANADRFGISIMKAFSCPHLFFNPSLTYFNSGKNPEVIAKIREVGIPITEEITVFNDKGEVDNIIIRDPGGLGFFLFND